jgi:hypothetical protein
MVDCAAIDFANQKISICSSCYSALEKCRRPADALANFRWINSHVPPELQNLTWIEEMLVARAHVVGKVVRLQNRDSLGYAALKGHVILLPQDTTKLLDILMSPSSLSDLIYVVWVGEAPDRVKLSEYFTLRKQKVLDALQWLCKHHDDYRNVTIN